MPERIETLIQNLNKAIVGKSDSISPGVSGFVFGWSCPVGRCLPGVGKTLLAKSLAKCLDGAVSADSVYSRLAAHRWVTTGTNIWNPSKGEFQFFAGAGVCQHSAGR